MINLSTIQSIAVIGASNERKKLGYSILKNILDYGFSGKVYPINLKEEAIANLRSYKSVMEISERIDLAVIAIPAPFVKEVLQECVKKTIPLVIIISAGFKETGDEGKKLEIELLQTITHSQTRIIGPNCLGMILAQSHVNASFAANFPSYDPISFISQSGALGTAFLDWIDENDLGIDSFISIGNKSDIDENILLEQLDNQKVIACYLEDIKDGKKLMEIGYIKNQKRPVLVLKPGKSEAAAKAISSHTGSLAGGHVAISTALKQSGYIEVNTIGELFNKIKAFAWQPIPKSNKIAIVTNAGGPAVITTDLIIEKGMRLADIDEKTHALLQEKLPRTANMHNPIDVIGDALSDRYVAAMEAVLQEDEVSALLVLLTPQIMTEIELTAKLIGTMTKYNKPIIASFIGGTLVEKGMKLLAKEKIPAYHFPETAVDVLSSMVWYGDYVKKHETSLVASSQSMYYAASHGYISEKYIEAQRHNLKAFSPNISEQIAKRYNIPVPESSICATSDEALTHISQTVHYPCALKISSPTLLHKSDIGGVITDIQDDNGVRVAFDKLEGIIEHHSIFDAHIEVQPYITDGLYTIIGAQRDANFGVVLLFGQGGIYTELMHDTTTRIAPISKNMTLEMIDETKIASILHGIRGQDPLPLDGIVQTLQAVQDLMLDYPFISSIDINPLIVGKSGSFAVDIKILL